MKWISTIDEFFYSKTLKDTVMIYLMIIGVIGFFFFYYLLPAAKKYRDNEFKFYNSTKTQLQDLKNKKMVLNSKIILTTKKIKNLSLTKISLKKEKEFFDELIKLFDFVEFNKYKWGFFVKNIVVNAQEEGLKIISFTNRFFSDNKGIINKKMEIVLKGKGEYKNLLYFLYEYENLKDLLKIESLGIDKNKDFHIKFTLYGYER